MPKIISTEQLKKLTINTNEQFYLIDVLSAASYASHHIPGATNIPVGPNIVSEVQKRAIPQDSLIIVYCSSAQCGASSSAAKKLEQAGYTNVVHYEAGLAGWRDAGYGFA